MLKYISTTTTKKPTTTTKCIILLLYDILLLLIILYLENYLMWIMKKSNKTHKCIINQTFNY